MASILNMDALVLLTNGAIRSNFGSKAIQCLARVGSATLMEVYRLTSLVTWHGIQLTVRAKVTRGW